uniref:Uncharacterized protein n=1 Tax=Arundo donax TaxID=35708 RepID=A0A0A8YGU2_ARUDO
MIILSQNSVSSIVLHFCGLLVFLSICPRALAAKGDPFSFAEMVLPIPCKSGGISTVPPPKAAFMSSQQSLLPKP